MTYNVLQTRKKHKQTYIRKLNRRSGVNDFIQYGVSQFLVYVLQVAWGYTRNAATSHWRSLVLMGENVGYIVYNNR